VAILLHEPGGHPMASQRALVAMSLEFAVPEAIRALRDVPGPARGLLAEDCAGLLAAYGESAWLAVRAHEDGEGLTRLARGLAALACRPGGVSFLGTCWVAVAAWEPGQAAA
jgi:hypothetical protein